MKKTLSLILSAALTTTYALSVKADAATDVSLWDKFIRYDLCIIDYDSLTSEEKELCHFIFDTEQAADDNIICERARRTLAGDTDLGERITLDDLGETYGIWDKYSPNSIYGWQIYTHCVPDVIHLGNDSEPAPFWYEYWLDDTGSEYVVFNEKTSPDNYRHFDVYDKGELLETITAADSEMPFKDIRDDEELMKEKELIQQDGGWYYTKPDGTAVFVWCDYAETVQVMAQMYDIDATPIEEPFIVADEINGCPVTAIESGAFRMSPVTKVVLPDTIEYIGMSAFLNCIYLNDIQLPKDLKYLGNSAFMYCTSLEDFDIDCPSLRLDPDTFNGCDALKSMKLNVREIGERSVPRNLESLELGDAVRKIGYNSFGNCKKLETLEIPLGTEQICQRASMYSGIKSVTIPPTVKVIGAYPAKTRTEFMSGMDDVPGRRPLTDEPICAFNADCVVYGYTGTEAERYAEEWGLEFVPLEYTEGDANFDGKFTIADAVSLQNYLLGRQETGLVYWKAADLCDDNRLDVFDMCLMRSSLTDSFQTLESVDLELRSRYTEYGLGNPKVELTLSVRGLTSPYHVNDVKLYDESDQLICTMSPCTDVDVWDCLIPYDITEECSKEFYAVVEYSRGEMILTQKERSNSVIVKFTEVPAP